MFIYGAIVPHSPFLTPGAPEERRRELAHSADALASVGEELKALRVETLLVVTTHGERYERALGIALHDPYMAGLREFGDLKSHAIYFPDFKLIDTLSRTLRRAGAHATTTTNDELDHASSVPLIVLEPFLESVKIVVVTPPVASARQLVDMGTCMREAVDTLPQRVAVLCVAELSHRLSELSPGGVHPRAEAFDASIRGAFADGNSLPLLKPTPRELADVGGEELDAIRLFWGILNDTAYRVEERAYEAPHGIGTLTLVTHVH
ncbi:MAG: class III extradiol dioxygenase subunit B-like domain-containing protein [Patescibacteria group bacterium]